MNYYNSHRRDQLKALTVGSAGGLVVRTDEGGAGEIFAQLIVVDQVPPAKADAEHPLRHHRLDAVLYLREGGRRMLPFVVITEDRAVPFVRQVMALGSTLHADESASWDGLHAHCDARRINHGIAFRDEGVNTNQAESFFSRLRRAEIGQHHHMGIHLQRTRARWLGPRTTSASPMGRKS